MTIQNQNTKNVYVGNGSTTVFPYTFTMNSDHPEYIHVYITGEDGIARETTDFKVDVNASNVVYPWPGSAAPALAAGQKITLLREVPLQQNLALVNQGPFFAESIERQLDDLEMQIQQLREVTERSLKTSVESTNFNAAIPLKPGKSFRINQEGTGFEVTEDPAVAMQAAQISATLATAAKQAAEEAANTAAAEAQDVISAAVEAAESAQTTTETNAAIAVEAARTAEGREYKNEYLPKNLIFPDALSQIINGIEWTVNTDGTVVATGTATANSDFRCSNLSLEAGQFIVTGCPAGGGTTTYDVYIQKGNGKGTGLIPTPVARDYGTESDINKFTLPKADVIFYCCRVFAGQTVNNLTFAPMVRLSTVLNANFQKHLPTNADLAPLLENGGEHIAALNDAAMTEICNVGASYFKFFNKDINRNTVFSYGGTLKRLWDLTPMLDEFGKYQMSCSTFTGILLYGITYGNSAYAVPGKNILSPTAYQSKVLYNDFCNFAENGTSYYSSQHLAEYCVKNGYAFKPAHDMSNIQPGDILFYNVYNTGGAHANRPFYRQVGHSETVAYRINDTKIAVWECGSERGPELSIRLIADMQRDLVLAARMPRPNAQSLSYDNLVLSGDIETSQTTNAELLKLVHLTKKIKPWRQYTLIARIVSGNINSYPAVYDTAGNELSLSSSGATAVPANNIYVIPFIPRGEVSQLQIKMLGATASNSVDYVCVVEGLVTQCSSIEQLQSMMSKRSLLQSGSESITAESGAYADATVTFQKAFTAPPVVVAGFNDSSPTVSINLALTCAVTNIKATGCTIRMFNGSSGPVTREIGWLAIKE